MLNFGRKKQDFGWKINKLEKNEKKEKIFF